VLSCARKSGRLNLSSSMRRKTSFTKSSRSSDARQGELELSCLKLGNSESVLTVRADFFIALFIVLELEPISFVTKRERVPIYSVLSNVSMTICHLRFGPRRPHSLRTKLFSAMG